MSRDGYSERGVLKIVYQENVFLGLALVFKSKIIFNLKLILKELA
jgi:hypothetical protein